MNHNKKCFIDKDRPCDATCIAFYANKGIPCIALSYIQHIDSKLDAISKKLGPYKSEE